METAKKHWAELDGYAVAHGIGYLQELPLDRFANFVWYMLTKEREPRDVEKIRAQLWQPKVGEVVTDPRSPWYSGSESNSLSALKRSLGA